jgi:ribose transport system ATP-binding protein
VVVLSSDAVELQGLCDRVLVFSRGSVVRILEDKDITEENITGAAIGADTARQRSVDNGAGRAAGIRRFLSGDYAPALILVALIVGPSDCTPRAQRQVFSANATSTSLLFLASALAFVSIGR